ncbi:MAG: hypothetical protein U0353_19745 [Sandaracinus sp.]
MTKSGVSPMTMNGVSFDEAFGGVPHEALGLRRDEARVRALPHVAVAALVLVAGCGASETGSDPTASASESRSGAAPSEATSELPSQLGDDGWRRWELPSHWPAPPSHSAAAPAASDPALAELSALRAENASRGVPDPRGATLHDVILASRSFPTAHGDPETRRALVVRASREGVRFAIADGVLWPIAAHGPELELATECGAAHDLATDGAWDEANARCPLAEAWPLLATLDEGALAHRYAQLEDVVAAEAFLSSERLDTLEQRGVASFVAADDAQCVRDLEAAAALAERGTDLPVETAVMRAGPPLPDLSDALLSQVLDDARARRDAAPAEGDEALVRALGEVALEPRHLGRLAEAPEVSAVVARGEAIVPRLLEALDDERTITRTFRIGMRHRVTVMPRYEAVWAALATILDHEVSVPSAFSDYLFMNEPGVLGTARSEMRAYWSTHGSESPLDRRWAVLQQEDAPVADRAIAAVWIAAPGASPRFFRLAAHVEGTWPSEAATMQGEALRAHTAPSVTELLVTLLHASLASDETRAYACDVAYAGARWDASAFGAAAADDLLAMVQAPSGVFCQASLVNALGVAVPRLPLELLRSAPDALLATTSDDVIEHVVAWSADRGFRTELTRAYRETPRLAALARIEPAAALARRGVAPSRDWLRARLSDEHEGGTLSTRSEAGWLATDTVSSTVDVAHPPSEPMTVRACDVTAHYARIALAIPFDLSADEATRDAALAQMRAAIDAPPPPAGQ